MNSKLEEFIKEIIKNYQQDGEPINIAIQEIAREFGLSIEQASLYVERLLGKEDDSHMSFKDSYTRNRFLGK